LASGTIAPSIGSVNVSGGSNSVSRIEAAYTIKITYYNKYSIYVDNFLFLIYGWG
jgi:hypothetical protein